MNNNTDVWMNIGLVVIIVLFLATFNKVMTLEKAMLKATNECLSNHIESTKSMDGILDLILPPIATQKAVEYVDEAIRPGLSF